MTGRLKGCSTVVTGGLPGVGLAIAEALAAQGANVAVGSRDAARWQGGIEPAHITDVGKRLSAYGGVVFAGPVDVCDIAMVERFNMSAGPTSYRQRLLRQ